MDPQRTEKIEFVIAHLQKSYDELNRVVYNQQREIDLLRRSVTRLQDELSSLSEASRTPRSLADDKPPHY